MAVRGSIWTKTPHTASVQPLRLQLPQKWLFEDVMSLPNKNNSQKLAKGLTDQTCEVLGMGLSSAEELYFPTNYLAADGGICFTTSHNPLGYVCIKLEITGWVPL